MSLGVVHVRGDKQSLDRSSQPAARISTAAVRSAQHSNGSDGLPVNGAVSRRRKYPRKAAAASEESGTRRNLWNFEARMRSRPDLGSTSSSVRRTNSPRRNPQGPGRLEVADDGRPLCQVCDREPVVCGVSNRGREGRKRDRAVTFSSRSVRTKGLHSRASPRFDWLPDLGSNQGPTD